MALRRGELARLGALINASHASLRGDFAVSTPEIDRLVELAQAEPGVYGARLTGGGFGGAILALVPVEQGHGVAMRVATRYAAETGKRPTVMMPRDAAR
jgi:galactokinase